MSLLRPILLAGLAVALVARAEAQTTVKVIKAERLIGEERDTVVTRDSLMRPVTVMVGSGLEWKTFHGKNTADRVNTIDGVPAGPIVVRDGGNVIISSARTFDLTMTHLGRPELQAARVSTPLAVKLTGLHPWQVDDRVTFFAPNARSYESNVQKKLRSALTPGATTLEASGDYLAFRGKSLIDGPGHRDEAWFLHMASATSPEGVRYLSTRKIFRTRKLRIENGRPVTVLGNMTDVRQDRKVTVDWQIGDPGALARAVSPRARATGGVWQVVAIPGGERFGGHDFGGTLLYVPIQPLGTLPRTTVTYGDPFPSRWGRVGSARLTYSISVPVLGTPEPAALEVSLNTGDQAAAFGKGPVRPLVTPVRDPKINGRSAFTEMKGVTVTPELTWTPPAVGRPTLYEVQVYRTRMTAPERKPDLQLMARVYTGEPRLAFPIQILKRAETYVLVIRAHQADGLDPTHPLHEPIRGANAPCVTAPISP